MKDIWNNIGNKTKIIAAISVLVCASLFYQWYKPSTPPAGVVTIAPVAKAVESVPKKEVPMTKAVVYDKAQVAKRVNLPQDVKDNPDKEVTSVSDIKPSKAGVILTTVIDKKTGDTTAYQEFKKQPLLGWGGEFRLGADYVALGKPEVNVHAQYDFMRVGNAYVHVRGEVDRKLDLRDKAEFKGMIGVDGVWGN